MIYKIKSVVCNETHIDTIIKTKGTIKNDYACLCICKNKLILNWLRQCISKERQICRGEK